MTFFLRSVFVLSLAILASSAAAAEEANRLVNLIYRHSGFGLERDIAILKQELDALGYDVCTCKINHPNQARAAEINLFLEDIEEAFFPFAKKNYFIPNPEWFTDSLSLISQLDMILCKTKESERIFKQYHPNTVFLGFTSLDHYDPKIKKNYRQALHVAGRSEQKGTNAVMQAWTLNPQLPRLTIFSSIARPNYDSSLHNMILLYQFLSDEELIKRQNRYALHLCPSETEGFGQYLMEALSCAAIPITTDAPPMNEFIKDKRCLAKYERTSEKELATNYYVDAIDLGNVVDKLMQLSDNELAEIGRNNRKFYLENKRLFQQHMGEFFPKIKD